LKRSSWRSDVSASKSLCWPMDECGALRNGLMVSISCNPSSGSSEHPSRRAVVRPVVA
jgi:hypothetical protein